MEHTLGTTNLHCLCGLYDLNYNALVDYIFSLRSRTSQFSCVLQVYIVIAMGCTVNSICSVCVTPVGPLAGIAASANSAPAGFG